MLLGTSASTILGALELANWIPVAMGTASAFGALASYLGTRASLSLCLHLPCEVFSPTKY